MRTLSSSSCSPFQKKSRMIIKILHLYSNTLYPGHSLNKPPRVKILFVKDSTKSTYTCQAINKKYQKNKKPFKRNKLQLNSTSKIAANCQEKTKTLKNINFFQSMPTRNFRLHTKGWDSFFNPFPSLTTFHVL